MLCGTILDPVHVFVSHFVDEMVLFLNTTIFHIIIISFQNIATDNSSITLKEASTHKSAATQASNVFVPRDLDLLTPK